MKLKRRVFLSLLPLPFLPVSHPPIDTTMSNYGKLLEQGIKKHPNDPMFKSWAKDFLTLFEPGGSHSYYRDFFGNWREPTPQYLR